MSLPVDTLLSAIRDYNRDVFPTEHDPISVGAMLAGEHDVLFIDSLLGSSLTVVNHRTLQRHLWTERLGWRFINNEGRYTARRYA